MKLILVYNADSGFFNAITDTAHKIFAPHTYECRLCYYTYGMAGMLRPWKDFLESLDLPLFFYHRNEFRREFPTRREALPAILIEADGDLETLVSAADINACEHLEDLMDLVRTRLPMRKAA